MGTDHSHRVCTFDEATKALMACGEEAIYVYNCFCRGPAREGRTSWKYCGHEVETCVALDRTLHGDRPPARKLDMQQAMELFRRWRDQGNFFRFMVDERAICCCCRCGCGFFRDEQGNFTADTCEKGRFVERTDAARCTQCGLCEPKCPYEARRMIDGKLSIDSVKCYGCSVFQYVCPAGAVSMVPRA